jgi:hypothetical protein
MSASDHDLSVCERIIDRSGDANQLPEADRIRELQAQGKSVSVGAARELRVLPPRISAHLIRDAPRSPGPVSDRSVAEAVRLQSRLDAAWTQAKGKLDGLSDKIAAQVKRCVPPKLDDDLQLLRFERCKVLVAHGPHLRGLVKAEKAALTDLNEFRARHGLTREPHYPASAILGIGLLLTLILIEAGINGVLFAGTSEQGLIGGWLEAFVLAVANVGVAFLLGRLVLPLFHMPGAFRKATAFVIAASGVAVVIAINLGGAHYRDFRARVGQAEIASMQTKTAAPSHTIVPIPALPAAKAGQPSAKPAVRSEPASSSPSTAKPTPALPTEDAAIARALANPLQLDSFASFFLVIIGLCGAAIACFDGYRMDDPFPGYGRRHRRYAKAREETAAALRKVVAETEKVVDGPAKTVARTIDAYANEIASLQQLHHQYANEKVALKQEMDRAQASAERELASVQRLAKELPGPDTEVLTLAVKPLPDLPASHVQNLESHERRLKTLQRSLAKERNALMSLFDLASTGIEQVLAEAAGLEKEAA